MNACTTLPNNEGWLLNLAVPFPSTDERPLNLVSNGDTFRLIGNPRGTLLQIVIRPPSRWRTFCATSASSIQFRRVCLLTAYVLCVLALALSGYTLNGGDWTTCIGCHPTRAQSVPAPTPGYTAAAPEEPPRPPAGAHFSGVPTSGKLADGAFVDVIRTG